MSGSLALRWIRPWVGAASLVLSIVGVARAGASPEPLLIPRALLFGNAERSAPQLSPDGRQLAWLAADSNGVQNVWVRSAGAAGARAVTHETHRPIGWYCWAGDGRHLLYLQDADGDERLHLYSADLEGGATRDLTPFRGVRAQNILVSGAHPEHVFAGLNLRDARVFDLHRIELGTGAVTLAAQNPGDVLSWSTDPGFEVRACTAFDAATQSTVIRVRDTAASPWRDLVVMPFERTPHAGQVVGGSLIAGFTPDGRGLLVHSAMGADHGRLVRLDTGTGAETEVIASHPASDVADAEYHPEVMFDGRTHRLTAVAFDPAVPEWHCLDDSVRADLALLQRARGGFPRVVSSDRTERRWIVEISRSDAPLEYVEYDRGSRAITPLYSTRPALAAYTLAAKRPLTIKARDGLPLPAYLTLPPGADRKPLPMVLLVHGGPWYRDDSGFDEEVQLLANRGYAVLQVNYRGSTGYGVKFLNAGTHQWGLATQTDLYDAVHWAVAQRIANPARVAIMGWSGGGYATLMALWQQPELFACGVDGVGPGDLRTLFASFPAWWNGVLSRWRRRVGDVEHDDRWNQLLSAQYHVGAIRRPLLIGQGQNDPRVTVANADAMVAALRAAGREVTYVVYPDEGHGFARPENNLDFHGRVEEFLARHIGGRAEPWQKIAGNTAELR